MRKYHLQIISFLVLVVFSTGCARDLSSTTYASSSTLSLTMEGKVISARKVTVKNNDKLGDNTGGMLAGGASGAILGTTVGGSGDATTAAVVGGALAGAAVGAILEDKLGQQSGYEYIIKVDTSKLKNNYYEGTTAMRHAISTATTSGMITVVQGTDTSLKVGEKVYVIFSDDRTRVIPASS